MQHRLHPVTGRKCSHHQDAVALLTVLDPLGYLTFKTSTSSLQSNTNYDRHHYETFLFGIDHLSFAVMTKDKTYQKELFSHNKPQTFILNKEN